MCNQALTICANKYIFILNIYTHFYKYKCSNCKLLNVTVSENINICKPSTRDRGCQKALLTVDCVVNYFNSRGSSVYMAALYASKAFDRVNHFSFFIALMKNNVPIPFLRVKIHWHLKLRGLVRWCGQYSDVF